MEWASSAAEMTPIDNLTYKYNSLTNRLNTISDATANAAGINVNGDQGCSSHTKWLVAEGKRSNRPGSRFENERGSISVVKNLFVNNKKSFYGRTTGYGYDLNDD